MRLPPPSVLLATLSLAVGAQAPLPPQAGWDGEWKLLPRESDQVGALIEEHLKGRSVAADALRLPLPDRSVDVVSSTLFLHHLDAPGVAALLRESARVARFAVSALDLTRHRVPLAVNALLGRVLYRSPITRHDGHASVLQAFTIPELRAIAARALPGALVRPAGPFVQGLLWKRP